MDYRSLFAISAAGMSVERTRVEVAALNLANANVAHSAGVERFTPLRVTAHAGFGALVTDGLRVGELPRAHVEPAEVPPRRVHEAGHPLADEEGFVSYPAVDPAAEMVSLMTASRSYEANLAAMNIARTLALKALEIGRGG